MKWAHSSLSCGLLSCAPHAQDTGMGGGTGGGGGGLRDYGDQVLHLLGIAICLKGFFNAASLDKVDE